MSFTVSKEELDSFHSIDRSLFDRLVREFRRNANQIMQVMALWLWMETEFGHPSMTLLLEETPANILPVFEESVAMLDFLLSSGNIPRPATPVTLGMMNAILPHDTPVEERIDFEIVYDNREEAVVGVGKHLADVCLRTFDDITAPPQAGNNGVQNLAPQAGNNAVQNLDPFAEPFVPGQLQQAPLPRPVGPVIGYGMHPGFFPAPDFRGFGPVNAFAQPNVPMIFEGVPPLPVFSGGRQHEGGQSSTQNQSQRQEIITGQFEVGESSNQAPRQAVRAPVEERNVMFLTFSRGYPVSAEELHDYFLRQHGDVVESIQMERTRQGTQPMYARVVFRSPTTVDDILSGNEKVKIHINRKHVWCRRFVTKNRTGPSEVPKTE
ncbi:hypothetical protein ACHQM5_021718 [Ranunculus cassubicifolius]